jgi:hypothetical protein
MLVPTNMMTATSRSSSGLTLVLLISVKEGLGRSAAGLRPVATPTWVSRAQQDRGRNSQLALGIRVMPQFA